MSHAEKVHLRLQSLDKRLARLRAERDRLAARFGIEAIVPPKAERERVHAIVYDELCQGRIVEASKQEYLRIVGALCDAGAEGLILGCTEIGLLLTQADASVPLFDTTYLHAQAAVRLAIDGALPRGPQGC